MPRRKSTKPAPAPTPPSSKSKSHKRALSSSATATPTAATAAAVSTPGSRASKRLKESAPSTAKKSKYFEGPDNDEDEDEDDAASADEEASDFNEADETSVADPSSASPSPSASEDEDDDEAEEERQKPKKRGRKPTAAKPGTAGTVGAVVKAGKELWRAGVKTGLGPGKQVFIERPKPRGDGGIKYVPGRVHPNTMAFLADLKKNNDREWLKSECAFSASYRSWIHLKEMLNMGG
jgi:hypothetical protein